MRFRDPEEDILMSVLSMKTALFIIFPVGLIAGLVRGDAPPWFYVIWVLGTVGTAFFTFVLLPNYQDWFDGKDLDGRRDDDDV